MLVLNKMKKKELPMSALKASEYKRIISISKKNETVEKDPNNIKVGIHAGRYFLQLNDQHSLAN